MIWLSSSNVHNHSHAHSTISIFSQFSSSSTGSSFNIKLKHSHSNINTSRHFFFNLLPWLWNHLPSLLISLPFVSVITFWKSFFWSHFFKSSILPILVHSMWCIHAVNAVNTTPFPISNPLVDFTSYSHWYLLWYNLLGRPIKYWQTNQVLADHQYDCAISLMSCFLFLSSVYGEAWKEINSKHVCHSQ